MSNPSQIFLIVRILGSLIWTRPQINLEADCWQSRRFGSVGIFPALFTFLPFKKFWLDDIISSCFEAHFIVYPKWWKADLRCTQQKRRQKWLDLPLQLCVITKRSSYLYDGSVVWNAGIFWLPIHIWKQQELFTALERTFWIHCFGR